MSTKQGASPTATTEETADIVGAAGEWNVGYFVGRFSPPHKGHIRVIKWLLTFCHRVVIGIGSCYEVGSSRHPILSFHRECMIARSLANENVPLHQIEFVYLQDFPESGTRENDGDRDGWSLWWDHITGIPGFDSVTHMITGNEEQILSEIRRRDIQLDCKLVDCEREMPAEFQFPYHASDLRKALIGGDYSRFEEIAATGTAQLLSLVGGLTGMKKILSEEAVSFNPGRQSVDCFVTCRDGSDRRNIMVLLGNRSKDKSNFPGVLACPGGGIDTYENPVDAALRELHEETGVRFVRESRHLVPGHVSHQGTQSILEMKFQGLYSDPDEGTSGTMGGSSLVFHIDVPDKSPKDFVSEIHGESDLDNVRFVEVGEALAEKLAYQQTEMLESIHRQLSNPLPGIY